MAKKVEISKEGYLELINQVYEDKLEERELAIDKYRSVDEQMETAEQFILMGKNAVSFLNLAANSSTEIAALAKEIKSIVYADTESLDTNSNLSEDFKNQISEQVKEFDKTKNNNNTNNTNSEE